MAIDAELATFLIEPIPNDMDDVLSTRRMLAQLTQSEIAQREPLAPGLRYHDQVIGDADGDLQVPVRIYRNENAPAPCGALVFFHGGAFVFGDLESEYERCVRFAHQANCVVVSVDYRLSPEHPYPAAVDDGFAALQWLRRNASQLGVDPTRIGVGGASAGGAIAAATVLRARDSDGPWLKAQLLIYPALDNETSSLSIEQFYRAEPWDGERTRKMWSMYLGGRSQEVPAYASPARAHDLTNFPPTYIMTAECDPLRDEALSFAQRLLEVHTVVEFHHFARTFHGFDVVAPGSRLSELALDEQVAFLTRELSK
jgi:acetyl esterase